MIADDWKVLMHALSIHAQAVPFSRGTTQQEKDAIADYMIGVADFIHAYPVPQYVKTISECGDEVRRRLEAALLHNKRLQNALREIEVWAEKHGGLWACSAAKLALNDFMEKRTSEPECTCSIDGTPYCKAKGTGNCKAENPS